jgi:eight-cysteine-cluster-containing protein|tara:strand:- start:517 stop:831 length:315 start_codon:yes stop_codon:yes gene_type:complete
MRTIIILLSVILLLTACEVQDEPEPQNIPEEPNPDAECQTDADCMTSGCSSTVCKKANDNPSYTTCEWKEEYACYRQITCGCNQGKCNWQETEEFKTCIQENKI